MLKHTNHVECSQKHAQNSLKQLNYEDTLDTLDTLDSALFCTTPILSHYLIISICKCIIQSSPEYCVHQTRGVQLQEGDGGEGGEALPAGWR